MTALGYVQTKYSLKVTTPLGPDVFLLEHLAGEESISSLYTFKLDLMSENPRVSFDAIVGKDVTVTVMMPDGGTRFIHGMVGRFQQHATAERFTRYTAEVRPHLWKLTKTADNRIFQFKSVPDIIKQVLSEHGVTQLRIALTRSYPPREYCVQYHETAFAFVSRLMESEGIFYFFEHAEGSHTVVLGDDESAFTGGASLKVLMFTEREDRDLIYALKDCSVDLQVTSGCSSSDDYNFKTPLTDLFASTSGKEASLKMYEYPAWRQAKGDVESLTSRRLEDFELPQRVIRGSAYHPDIRPGKKLTVSEHMRGDVNGQHVIWRAWHEGSQDSYSNTFEAFPAGTPFRPDRVTPEPRIESCQTAEVVGKAGEEITTDEYGRIKVKFHWDQAPGKDENSSCWIRVAQAWAGKQWGAMFIPRIGQEVVVSFLDGHPDRPLVTGSVYNAVQNVPYPLPANQTRSTIKSDSSKGHGGFNEIRFEDEKSSEEFFMHAQKDMNIRVLNDQTSVIAKNRSVTIEEVNDLLKVQKGNRTVEIAGKESHTIKGERALDVTGAESHTNKNTLTYKITGDVLFEIGGKLTFKVTGDTMLQVAGNVKVQSAKNIDQQAGMNATTKAGLNVQQEAGASMTSKAGAMHNVEAGAILALKGAMVKIN